MKLLRLLLVGWGLIAVCLAEAKDVLDVLVVDPDGRPVSNVVVTVRTMNKLPLFGVERDADFTEYQATTDGNGRAEVRFRCLAGCFDWWVEGDGYYASDLHYEEFASEEPSSPLPIGFLLRQYRKQVRITLLPEINPRPMCKSDWHNKHKFPESQSACGFDLEKGDFVRPHGYGEVADFLLTRNTRMGKNVWGGDRVEYFGEMKFEPPNGAYCVPVYPCREMEFPYRADTNQVFMTEIPYEDYEDADAKTPLIKNGWCMVIRSRAKLDAEGKIVGAHYSVIMGKCTLDKEFEYIKALFNPEAEDTNLEWDDPVRRQFIEEQKRGHR